ncbi:imm11 family protein [Pseudomonas promysalinigenes]|uniref:imm11 family protein n=1 Tax=Pseudomonas promysalinigenes TaxID=485898 RepID=UPI0037C8FFB9
MIMKYYYITQSDEFKTLVGKGGELALYDAAQQYAFGKDSSTVFSRQYELEFNSDDKRKKDGSDVFTFFSPVLVLTSKAKSLLQSIASDSFVDVDVLSPNPDHLGVVVDAKIDGALNKELSEFDEYPNGLVVYKLVLNHQAVQGFDVFRVTENPLSIYVSDRFLEAAKRIGLKGLDFKEVEAV